MLENLGIGLDEILLAVVIPLLTWAWTWIAKKLNAKQIDIDFGNFLIAFVQREKDKYLEELKAARDPNSPGGTEITKEERSQARENVWNRFKNDPNVPAKVKEYAFERGAEFVKGLAGNLLDKITKKND